MGQLLDSLPHGQDLGEGRVGGEVAMRHHAAKPLWESTQSAGHDEVASLLRSPAPPCSVSPTSRPLHPRPQRVGPSPPPSRGASQPIMSHLDVARQVFQDSDFWSVRRADHEDVDDSLLTLEGRRAGHSCHGAEERGASSEVRQALPGAGHRSWPELATAFERLPGAQSRRSLYPQPAVGGRVRMFLRKMGHRSVRSRLMILQRIATKKEQVQAMCHLQLIGEHKDTMREEAISLSMW